MRRRKRKTDTCSTKTLIQLYKEAPFPKGPEIMCIKKGSPRLEGWTWLSSPPPKAKRPANLWALLPSTKSMKTSTTTTASIACPRVAGTTTIMASTAGCARYGDCPALLCPVCPASCLIRTGIGKNKELKRGRRGNKNCKPNRRKKT